MTQLKDSNADLAGSAKQGSRKINARKDGTAGEDRLQAAIDYLTHGLALCKIPTGKKGPEGADAVGWNTSARAVRDQSAILGWEGNIGLLHAWSRTCAIDVDDYQHAREWLEEQGVNLDALLAADDAVQISSGRAGRAKLLYRVPDGIDPLSLSTVQITAPEKDAGGKHPMWLELRCADKTGTVSVQDVLPPSIHKDTGRPYRWAGVGSWRALPALPDVLLKLWRSHAGLRTDRKARGAIGPGTSAEVVDFVRRLSAANLKPYRCGNGYRSHCPHHIGESGTTLHIDEGNDGKVLVHCFSQCTPSQIFSALNAVAPRDTAIPTISELEQTHRFVDATKAAKAANDGSPGPALPSFPPELLSLPHGLGQMQSWILGYMTHPSAAVAGFTSLAVFSHFAMSHIKVDSRDGLGLNEQYLLLAPTGFGKEDQRKAFDKLAVALPDHRPANAGNLWPQNLPHIQYAAPASQQGLHRLMEEHHAQTFLADEFAEWLGHAASDSHKQQALGHLMQAYSKAFGTLSTPAIANKENAYKPVANPRVLVFATSTAERILETINASQADSGALNRFVIAVAEQDRIAKRYDVTGKHFVPPTGLVDLIAWISALDDTTVTLTNQARAYYVEHDSTVIEPLSFRDPRLAKRLTEQAFKMAALIALSDRRIEIDVHDIAVAYAVREGLYQRTAALIGFDGALSGMHQTGRALEQLRQRLEAKPFIYRANLPKESRQFSKLSLPEREAVIRALINEGWAKMDGGRFVSNIHSAMAA